MPVADPTATTRICPKCGRRVPRRIEVCRCGTNLGSPAAGGPAAYTDATAAQAPFSDLADGVGLLLGVVASLGAMVLFVYWVGRPPVRAPRPPATLPMKIMPAPVEAGPPSEPGVQPAPSLAPGSAPAAVEPGR